MTLSFDDTRFPLVFLTNGGVGLEPLPEQLENLLARHEAFVLITAHRPDEGEQHGHAERKKRALLFKRLKARLRSFCRGIIFVDNGEPLALAVRMSAQVFGLAFGIAVIFVEHEEAAVGRAASLLHG